MDVVEGALAGRRAVQASPKGAPVRMLAAGNREATDGARRVAPQMRAERPEGEAPFAELAEEPDPGRNRRRSDGACSGRRLGKGVGAPWTGSRKIGDAGLRGDVDGQRDPVAGSRPGERPPAHPGRDMPTAPVGSAAADRAWPRPGRWLAPVGDAASASSGVREPVEVDGRGGDAERLGGRLAPARAGGSVARGRGPIAATVIASPLGADGTPALSGGSAAGLSAASAAPGGTRVPVLGDRRAGRARPVLGVLDRLQRPSGVGVYPPGRSDRSG